jgi:oligopeptide/dipeptide ABC transporter ATP-binding protein
MLALFYHPSSGSLSINGTDATHLNRRQLKPLRKQVQMIFQDPVSSLNPRHTIEAILTEPLKVFSLYTARQRIESAKELLDAVGLTSSDLKKYPHEFSGGQRQRISIARALVLNPGFIVADEPVSALDVSVQSQILNLLMDLRKQFELTYLFISHDLAVVNHLADRIAVMYLGRIIEVASKERIFTHPVHPYTRALLSSAPGLTPNRAKIGKILQGDPPSPLQPPGGCVFHPRCRFARDNCKVTSPSLVPLANKPGHTIACHLADELS